MSIQRYDSGDEISSEPCPHDSGDWVKYSDHETDVKRLTAENAKLQVLYDALKLTNTPLRENLKTAYVRNGERRDEMAELRDSNHNDHGKCRANKEGDCVYSKCPQLRDGEPVRSNRHCPIDT